MDLVNQYRLFEKFVRNRAIKRRNYFHYLQQKLSESLEKEDTKLQLLDSISSESDNKKFS